REAAKQALSGFMTKATISASQIEFLNLIINHLTEHGIMEAERLYESPFTDVSPRGPDGIFSGTEIEGLLQTLETIKSTARAA
ncbi:MAG: hypothetical protein RLZZ403_1892, partial [Pseudomonadota bacterium]